MNKLIVAEAFYSLQCEGREIGVPAVFLRLGGCNLMCNSEHWRCDTIEVWQKGKATNFEDVLDSYFIGKIKKGAHLVITGGEPLLHQEAILSFVDYLYNKHNLDDMIIEVETNGTIVPKGQLLRLIDRWNVSPKLANCGETYEKRVNENALMQIQMTNNSIFKFVIKEAEDVLDILQDYDFLNFKNVILMPAGATREELNITRPIVVEQCKLLGLRYSERLHIVIWDKKTGV